MKFYLSKADEAGQENDRQVSETNTKICLFWLTIFFAESNDADCSRTVQASKPQQNRL